MQVSISDHERDWISVSEGRSFKSGTNTGLHFSITLHFHRDRTVVPLSRGRRPKFVNDTCPSSENISFGRF